MSKALKQYGKNWVDNKDREWGSTKQEKQRLSDLLMQEGYSAKEATKKVKEYSGILRDIQERAFNSQKINEAIVSGNDSWLKDMLSEPLRDMRGKSLEVVSDDSDIEIKDGGAGPGYNGWPFAIVVVLVFLFLVFVVK